MHTLRHEMLSDAFYPNFSESEWPAISPSAKFFKAEQAKVLEFEESWDLLSGVPEAS